jgi:acetyl esterase
MSTDNVKRLFYPVTDTSHESTTYTTYANGPYLTPSLLHWMYAAFFPTSPSESTQARCTNLGSPLRMTKEKAAQQPSTLIVVAGADPLQEEGKLFGHLLQSAGVETAVLQADGQVHDFVMLEPTRGSETARAVVELASFKLKKALALA